MALSTKWRAGAYRKPRSVKRKEAQLKEATSNTNKTPYYHNGQVWIPGGTGIEGTRNSQLPKANSIPKSKKERKYTECDEAKQ
ncbi:hypothetical protein NECAME_07518 [Necator americanus]|uniref:Uncharacterized protein n=1 Tax=Necator americanus TaxID=51031 RepID=W2TM74_NECAM|nr:hypothetical protein NECAME_07518 [Necator americanus]ETN83220.1 hypothetical protein NECAME_07518 [Necator americanus]